jgi:hypothetical protein
VSNAIFEAEHVSLVMQTAVLFGMTRAPTPRPWRAYRSK